MDFFSRQYNGEPFEAYSGLHWTILSFNVAFNLLLVLWFVKNRKQKETFPVFRYLWAGLLFFSEISYTLWSISVGDWNPSYSLPLHLCDAASFLAAVMLIKKNYKCFEVVYFWGMGGSLQALLTPDIGPYSFPHFVFINFFITHGAIITSVLYMTAVESFRPQFKSIFRVFLITNIYAAIIIPINILVRGNYLYLCQKPASSTLMDFLGPWPWYILSLELVTLVIFVILYLPYLIQDFFRKRKKARCFTNSKQGQFPM